MSQDMKLEHLEAKSTKSCEYLTRDAFQRMFLFQRYQDFLSLLLVLLWLMCAPCCSHTGNRGIVGLFTPKGEVTVIVVDTVRNADAIPNMTRLWREAVQQLSESSADTPASQMPTENLTFTTKYDACVV